jgi:Peptidase family M1 domain
MHRRALASSVVVGGSAVVALVAATAPGALAGSGTAHSPAGHAPTRNCVAGAHTLSKPGDRVYPETGNGGYRSVHTDVHLRYDAASNRFVAGNHVVITDRATRCLTSFSLDLERRSANHSDGPRLRVRSVRVNGRQASFHFARPTYPGDPRGQNDPRPRAHQASQTDPVGGPHHNALPPACSPEVGASMSTTALDGTRCPANKLVITPRHPLPRGKVFTVTVSYVGRPGLHNDGDGSTEGWFRSDSGGFVTTEPVGTEDWMPLNDYPTAKPTYDFFDTVTAGRTAVANGVLVSSTKHAADAAFPHGSTTWHWHSPAPIASYLVESSVGDYTLTQRTAADGVRYFEAQDTSIPAAQQKQNLAIMDKQQDVTDFESQFNGPFPFTSDGVVVGTPPASFEEEMQTMITFAGGRIDLDTLYHENMHQWWGDNVTEGSYSMTFFKEGLATLGEYLFAARQAETAAGGPATVAGNKAFRASLVHQFDATYSQAGSFWTGAPSKPTAATLFNNDSTYQRSGATYVALHQILGETRFVKALQRIQTRYGGSSITEPQLERVFRHWLPVHTAACGSRLSTFFHQWFDTAYPAGGGARRPRFTGPGLSGPGFYVAGCHRG